MPTPLICTFVVGTALCSISFPATDSLYNGFLSSLSLIAASYLDKELDWDHDDVNTHLSVIADQMVDWEEKLSTKLGMTEVEIHDLKEGKPGPLLR